MDRLRAALVGCLLAGGVLFGARPVPPSRRALRPIVFSSELSPVGSTAPRATPAWFAPPWPGLSSLALRAQAGLLHGTRPAGPVELYAALVIEQDGSGSRPLSGAARRRIRCLERARACSA